MQKLLIVLIIIALVILGAIFCRQTEKKEKNQWTKSSSDLLKIREMPKKPLKKSNLFE